MLGSPQQHLHEESEWVVQMNPPPSAAALVSFMFFILKGLRLVSVRSNGHRVQSHQGQSPWRDLFLISTIILRMWEPEGESSSWLFFFFFFYC